MKRINTLYFWVGLAVTDLLYLLTFFVTGLLLAACDVEQEHDVEQERAGAYWVDVECNADGCWGLHPMGATADVWAELTSSLDLRAALDVGDLVHVKGVSGYGGCAGNQGPGPSTPVSFCAWDVADGAQRCWGGDGEWLAEYRPSCVIDFNYPAVQVSYLPGSCGDVWPMGLSAFAWVHGSIVELDTVRAAANNGYDTVVLRTGCSLGL